MKKLYKILLAGLIIIIIAVGYTQIKKTETMKISDNERNIKIVVTDSGLGGLSVVEDLAKKLKESGYYKNAEIIFANALFDANSGYNRLTDRSKKIRIFNKALYGIEKKFKPDYIFIACNTLSVLYNETEFSENNNSKVVTIVDYGVNLIYNQLKEQDSSKVIIFGTKTTIKEDTYKKLLVKKNIGENRIVSEACPELQEYIERDPKGTETFKMIEKFTNEAINKLNDTVNELYISLNCTHYGYAGNLWEKAINEHNVKLSGVLNPNYEMYKVLFPENYKKQFDNTKINISVVSKVKLAEQNINSMTNLFKYSCPELAEALQNYELKPDLF